jgi:hypothetical protein
LIAKISLPLSVFLSKSIGNKFILNLNTYRNRHFRSLASAKVIYSDLISEEVKKLPSFSDPVNLEYTYFAKDKRLVDVSNPCSIIDKFACDALVKYNILQDDSIEFVVSVCYKFGGIDRENPRCDLVIKTA